MWFFMVILLVLFLCSAQDECSRSISMSHNGDVYVALGQRFNLTCNFDCFNAADQVQLLKDKLLLSELSLSRDCPESKRTIVLLLFIPAVQYNDSGEYQCRSEPREGSISVTIKVVDTDKRMDKDKHNITGAPQSELTSEVQSTCDAPVSWNAPLWYLLCKTALFLICSMSAVWKNTRSVP